MSKLNFLRRVNKTDYLEDQTVTIGGSGGSDTIEDLPISADVVALEVEVEGTRYVVLAHPTKS